MDVSMGVGNQLDDNTFAIGFGAIVNSERIIIIIPFYAIVSCIVAVAAIPWLHFRFSLRTLLIATTLIAVMLGVSYML